MITKTAIKAKFEYALDILKYNWIQGNWWVQEDDNGNVNKVCKLKDATESCKMCLDGAFQFVCRTLPGKKLDSGYLKMNSLFEEVVTQGTDSVIGYNDTTGRTKKQVLNAIRKCIKVLN